MISTYCKYITEWMMAHNAGHMERYDWRYPDADSDPAVGYLQNGLEQRGKYAIQLDLVDTTVTPGFSHFIAGGRVNETIEQVGRQETTISRPRTIRIRSYG
jgi:hypothetical protein